MAPVNTGIKTGLVLKEKSRASFGSFMDELETEVSTGLLEFRERSPGAGNEIGGKQCLS